MQFLSDIYSQIRFLSFEFIWTRIPCSCSKSIAFAVELKESPLSFLRVGQHLVRVVDFLEFVLKLRTCDIGMIFAAHLAIGLFDLIITGRSVNAQYFVVIRHSRSFSLLVPRAIVP